MDLSQNWLLMAVLTPTFWAICCVLDCCLIGNKIYRKPSDGAIVSSLFCLAPLLFLFIGDTQEVVTSVGEKGVPTNAVLAGLAFALHLFFYFRTLHRLNDVSGAETFISLSVLIVPLFAWVMLGERLPGHFYLAFIIAASGVLIQCLPAIRKVGLLLLVNMLITMTAVSLSMVLQAGALESHGFILSTVFFNLTVFFVAMTFVIANPKSRQRVVNLFQHYPVVLITGEVLSILAVLSSHRATQLGPSVSIVALIECLLPLMIIAVSSALILMNRYWPLLSSQHESILSLQLQGMQMKIGALSLVMISLLILMV